MPRSAALTAYSDATIFSMLGLHTTFLAARSGAMPCNAGEEFDLLTPGCDIGDRVLKDLELADRLAESLALFHVVQRVLENAVDGSPGIARQP